jgi:DNA-binding MarR family transcriptional regulator
MAIRVSRLAKLTPRQVLAILQRWHHHGDTQKVLATEYGVSMATISQIVAGRVYRRVRSRFLARAAERDLKLRYCPRKGPYKVAA